MCLDKVDSEIKVARKTGYKVVRRDFKGVLYSIFGKGSYAEGKWQEDFSRSGTYQGEVRYPTGFHIFARIRNARTFAASEEEIHKVEFNDVVAIGWQGDSRVIVARKIKIGEKVK